MKAALTACIAVLLSSSAVFAGELHVFTSDPSGFSTHSVWYDDGKEVTVVDAQFTPQIAKSLLADIKSKTTSPVTRVIVTHPNPDKFNGLSAFHAQGVESIASEKTAADMPGVDKYKRFVMIELAKMFTNDTYPKFEPVKTTYHDKMVIKLKSGETISLFELPAGVSSDQTVVRIDATSDLVVGDLVHSNTHAWLEGGIVDGKPRPTLEQWKADLLALKDLSTGKVYGGRGDFLPVSDAVNQQISYLNAADKLVGGYVVDLGARKSELLDPAKQMRHWQALQAEFVKAFPDYKMPDLIGFSVYGLAVQKLAVGN
ncbi:MBL fold metallo-hydrolase [Rhizobium leguminosarum]|uniref:MBL fold metallo-hydrolase n=1 Tax=Rhizobium leguminosarum TaxID=384 RepID=UPI001C8FC841|nr:MBL fold metallo-hydrolase [Rhizobium leguminosarum]MBY2907700.1 MBL fold metallo-hydrolase [Rhizobium leguminosarum]